MDGGTAEVCATHHGYDVSVVTGDTGNAWALHSRAA
jgi:hypothetical protein